ncbi:hypothetical protein HZP98_06785 [Elizabethkingia anophelis]|uniref:class I lanthipeptide n=1 Tax=Elizabethkingia anophelis TaxID=1117645 RepID=UPI000666D851|nr:class I lanthipeptide [Elizabethkingia anophelis]MCT3919507.1 hypothetical protein [Elizabethkingia anophelis]MCT3951862.1 hypothetical protein [Elizabethkingia anophelis]MCT3955277.1 hypothetical protein [Elizabethkingia anophelis]MCT3986967.1 hypothetical protein [Elizabethkingia anophelis]MCT4065404.1 hypothetical protein [Elizabethkingia anophelis]
MKKKKITKLEIRKEDILNLSQDESQKIIGGAAVQTIDFGDTCPETFPANCPDRSEDCTGMCTAFEGCQTDDCMPGYTEGWECERT